MTSGRADWNSWEEEPLLAEYLANRVCGRAAGRFEDVCTYNAPRDKYFIGSLRPSPPDAADNAGPALHPGGFLDELLTKLAPVAFGAEFRLRPEREEILTTVQLQWSCYYRVLPTLEEQREHQRHCVADAAASSEGEAPSAEGSAGPRSGQDLEAVRRTVSSPGPPMGRHRPSPDVLFPKYRKLRCSAEGRVIIRRGDGGVDAGLVDSSDFLGAIQAELDRVRNMILADPDHLRTGPNTEERVRVPPDALDSSETYATFRRSLSTDVLPDWRWELDVQLRLGDAGGECVVLFEATNTSQIDTRSWHSEGFFFDVSMALTVEQAAVLPFELEVAPRSFRYDRNLWGRGFNCAVTRVESGSGQWTFATVNAPLYRQPRYSTNTEPPASFEELAADPSPVLRRILAAMRDYEQEWGRHRGGYTREDPNWEARHGAEYDRDHEMFRSELARFELGCRLVEEDADIRLAFELTNRSFALSRRKTAWRLFQVVFIVSQIPDLQALRAAEDPATSGSRGVVDIVYFPTGGGKTEAYLGVIVFHCFFDRLRGKTAGVTTWTRFPLRLLTLQQTQRVADVIGAAELIRRSVDEPRLSGSGIDGFAVGYFVGQEATPNELTPPRRGEPPDANWSIANDPEARQRWKKIVKCPSCQTTTVVVDFDPQSVQLIHRCLNSSCRFPGGTLPVHIIDNEIYRFLPSVVVGTIDKLAGLGNQRKLSLVLGQVTGRCAQHGYYNAKCCQKECSDPRSLRRGAPVGISGPTLFVQDELHLLKEGLGTFDGHYETFLQTLLQSFGQDLPAKIIASSATIEAFDRQVRHLYGRQARVFPGYGPTLGESFYARTLEYPQRLFVGVLPHNKTIFNAALELIAYYHEEVEDLARLPASAANPFGGRSRPGTADWFELLDPYSTSLSYFSATRELSSIRTDLDAHVNNELDRAGYAPLRIAELSGSTSTESVTQVLTLLEGAEVRSTNAPNAILATSMISHGVDIDRLNCMIFYGMPKQNAEYIQSSSRVGRQHVGLVFTCLKPARERDQSHFAYFQKYHEFLGRLVEPVAINRWSKFSIQRTIPGLFMAILLQRIANASGDANPNRYYMVEFVKRQISEGAIRADSFIEMLERAYLVRSWGGPGAAVFEEEIGRRVRQFLDQILGAGGQTAFVSDSLVPSPMRSLRDVDEQIEIELDSNGSTWGSRAGR